MRLGRIDGFRVEQLMLKTAQTIQERNTLCDNERQILFNAPLELRLVVAMRKEHTHTHTYLAVAYHAHQDQEVCDYCFTTRPPWPYRTMPHRLQLPHSPVLRVHLEHRFLTTDTLCERVVM